MDEGIQQITRLFALLLGFGIAEVLRGLARAWRITAGAEARKAPIRIGALVPLLGLLVILDQTSFVITAAELQAHLPFGYLTLLAVLLTIGGYYLVSTFVFPARPAEWPNFDVYYRRVKLVVLPGMAAINLAVLAFEGVMVARGIALPQTWGAGGSGMGFGSPVMLVAELAFFPLLAALALVRSPRVSKLLLLGANGLILVEAIWPLVAGTLHPAHLPHQAKDVEGLFALLIGLSIAVLLGGMARCWRIAAHVEDRRAKVRIGPLVPLLGLLLALNQISFYLTAVRLSAQVPFSYASLLAVLVVIGGYYAISTFVFPDTPRECPDHDDYYLRTNRIVLGGMILVNVAVMAGTVAAAVGGFDVDTGATGAHSLGGQILDLVLNLVGAPLLIVLYFVTSRRANLVLLSAANLIMIADALTELM